MDFYDLPSCFPGKSGLDLIQPRKFLASLSRSPAAAPADAQVTLAFVAGAAAGSVAAFVTTPFDVIKTRQQVAEAHHGAKRNGLELLDLTIREPLY